VKLFVYSITGQKVRELTDGKLTAGKHTAVWDGKDDSGNAVSSGVYMARLESGGKSAVAKMVMMK
jgi:flagellar hook assembly protein FlgD